ncbi:MAG: heavy metal translocating P-type ATPase, partial [Burkholderiales bacterium]
GQAIPADGKISLGSSNINQAAITGESIPVSKTVEDEVFAGTLNGEGLIEVAVTKLVSESTLAKMLRLITEADAQKSGTQRFAEKFERIFVPVVLIGVLLIAFLPYWFGVMKLHDSIFMALVVLVSASPCALALATPVAVLVGISRAAKDGILIKGGAALENLGYTKVIAFDKTGTLTEGKPEIVEVINLSPMAQNQMLGLIMGLEQGSAHPLAVSIIKYGQTQRIQALAVDNIQNVDGKGIQGSYLGKSLRLGSRKMFEFIPAQIAAIIDRLEQSGNTTMLLALEDELIGIIALADRIRIGASQALTSLKQLGVLKSVMLTGDNETVAKVIGQELNIDEIRASLLPEEKVQQIQMLTQEYNYIAMIGDGVNDAPAMANASVGIAMGGTKT